MLIPGELRAVLDRINLFEAKICAGSLNNKSGECLKTGREILGLLGIKFPDKIDKKAVRIELIKTRIALAGKTAQMLSDLPVMTDPYKTAAVRVLIQMGLACCFEDPVAHGYITLYSVRMAVNYGKFKKIPVVFAWYGMFLCQAMNKIDLGFRFGNLALSLLELQDGKALRVEVLPFIYPFIIPCRKHIRETLKSLEDCFQSGCKAGATQLAATILCRYSFWAGRKLEAVEKQILFFNETYRQFEISLFESQRKMDHQVVLNLMGRSENPSVLRGESYDQKAVLPLLFLDDSQQDVIFIHRLNSLYLGYLFNEHHLAGEHAGSVKAGLGRLTGVICVVLYCFYGALNHLALYDTSKKSGRKRHLRRAGQCQKEIKKWARHAPMNFLHKYYLVEAERLRVLKKDGAAADAYDHAINLAKEYECLNEEALANELAGKFYLQKGKTTIARAYMAEARSCYSIWGAVAKVRHLDGRYKNLLTKGKTKESNSSCGLFAAETEKFNALEKLDLSAAIRASRIISGEIVLDKLIDRIMNTVIENAGAQKGALILNQNGRLTVDAYIEAPKSQIVLEHPVPLSKFKALSAGIIHFAARTKDKVVLSNAAAEGIFTSDPYIAHHKPKSVLCIPILLHSDLTGVLYLENSSAKGAFTADRVEVLNLISTQAAISIENARFYADLEDRVARRTKDLHQANIAIKKSVEELRIAQSQLVQSEKMASLGELIAGIAHEINTPLGVIISNNDLVIRYLNRITDLEKESKAAGFMRKTRQTAEISKKACDSIMAIVKSLRVFARLDEAEFQQASIESLIEDTLSIMKNKLKAGIKVEKLYLFHDPILCFPSRLNQVFINIINNAYDAMNGQGTLNISLKASKQHVYVALRDTGPGIPEDLLPKLFSPGFTTKGVGVGTGLGLSICYQIIVENHKGRIWIENFVDGGAVVKIEIPILKRQSHG